MGYRRKPKTYKLVWPDDSDMHGLEVRTKGALLGELLSIVRLAQNVGRGVLDDLPELFERFGAVLVSWNLEGENGEPVPADLSGLHSQDLEFVQKILAAWMEAVGGVADPLAESSSSGVTSLERSLPMEPLSTSQAS